MKFLLKVLVLVTLIVISKLAKEEAISMNKPLQEPAGFQEYTQKLDADRFAIPVPSKPTTTVVSFN